VRGSKIGIQNSWRNYESSKHYYIIAAVKCKRY
jgi:hypothetical protein